MRRWSSLASDWNPLWLFDKLLDAIAEHPNVTFVIITIASLLSAVWVGLRVDAQERIWLGIEVTSWCLAGGLIAGSVALVALLACIVAALRPDSIGRAFAKALIALRVVRFVYGVAAFLMAGWAFVSILVGGLRLRAYVLSQLRAGDQLTHRPYPSDLPWQLNVLGMIIVALFFLIAALVLGPVLRDVFRVIAGAVETQLYFRWASRAERDAGEAFAPLEANDGAVDVLVVSDLHATHPDAKTVEGDRSDARMRQFVRDSITRLSPRLVIAAGDVTDTGDHAAWNSLREIFPGVVPVLVAPGNHDVNFRDAVERHERSTLVRNCLDLDPDAQRSGSYSEGELEARAASLTRLGGLVARRGNHPYPKLFDDDAMKLSVLILNSNRRPSTSPITNAFGRVDETQLRDAAALLQQRNEDQKRHTLLIVMHHHVFPPPSTGVIDLFLICLDADAVIDFALEHQAAAVVHGHKHMPYVREIRKGNQRLSIVSVGSALYEAAGPCARQVVKPSVTVLQLGDRDLRAVWIVPDRDVGAPTQ